MNLSAVHSCGIREPVNFGSEAEIVHANQGGVGQAQGLEEIHESNVALARKWWSHGGGGGAEVQGRFKNNLPHESLSRSQLPKISLWESPGARRRQQIPVPVADPASWPGEIGQVRVEHTP